MSGSQGERKVLIPAGGTIPVRVPGDFIFIKFADRPVVVRIGGQSITMRAGDRRKIERRADNPMAPAFDNFDLENPSADAPLAVEFVAGEGDYTSQIINGEVVIAPGLRRADGRWYDDTRRDIDLRLSLSSIQAVEHEKYGILHSFSSAGYQYNEIGRIRNLTGGPVPGRVFCESQGGYQSYLDIYRGVNDPGNRVSIGGWYPQWRSAPRFCRGRYWYFQKTTNHNFPGGGQVIQLDGIAALTEEADHVDARVKALVNFKTSTEQGYHEWYYGFGVIMSWGDFLYLIATAPDRSRHLLKVTTAGELLGSVQLPGGAGFTQLGIDGDVIHVGGHAGFVWDVAYSARDLSMVPVTLPDKNSLGNNVIALERVGPREYFGISHRTTHSSNARIITDRSWVDAARGSVSACSGAGMFVAESAPTEAALELVRDSAGRPVASGQVIKAALDIYLGEAGGYVAPDYLDHIYGVEFEYANYMRPASIQTGGSSFARAGIADDFKNVVLPQRIKITADAGLVSESGQWNS